MTYGLSPRLFLENGPAVLAARTLSDPTLAAHRAWRGLDHDHRLLAVEAVLGAANDDHGDGFPLAL